MFSKPRVNFTLGMSGSQNRLQEEISYLNINEERKVHTVQTHSQARDQDALVGKVSGKTNTVNDFVIK